MEEIALRRDFQLARVHDLDLGWGHTAHCRASFIDLIEIEELFVDGWADVRADGHLRPTLLDQLKRADLKTG